VHFGYPKYFYEVRSLSIYPFLTYNGLTADTLRYAETLTFDLWPSTFLVYRLLGDQTCAKFQRLWNNLRWSQCDLNTSIWALSAILNWTLSAFTQFRGLIMVSKMHQYVKFQQNQANRC